MKPSLIIPRIRAQVSAFSNRVGGTAAFEAAASSNEDIAVPAAFVVPLGEEVSDSVSAPGVVQIIDDRFGVIVVVSNTADEGGADGAEQVDDLRASLLTALTAYRPSVAHHPIRYMGGQHLAIDRARLWHQFEFATRYILKG